MHEPSVRYRAQYALDVLHDEYSVSSTLVMPGYSPLSILRFLAVYLRVLLMRRRRSVIVFQKLHTDRLYVGTLKALLRLRPQATLYDTDDADYLRFPAKTIHHFAARCSACTVGSAALHRYFLGINPQVALLTSPVISHMWKKGARNSVFTVGWIGYWCDHRDSLMQLVFPGLRTLGFQCRLVLIGMPDAAAVEEVQRYFRDHPHITVVYPINVDWLDEDGIYERISSFDAGLAPLLDTEMNRAKSAFKAKQYLSCGVPVLGSAVGENASFILHGTNGFVCNGPDDYRKRLTDLATMQAEKYATLSGGALASASRFSMSLYCQVFLGITSALLEAEKVR